MNLSKLEVLYIKRLIAKKQQNKEVVEFLKTNKSSIYDIYNNRRKLTKDKFDIIIGFYDEYYNHGDKLLNEAYDIVLSLFILVSKDDNNMFMDVYNVIDMDLYSHSKAFIYTDLFYALKACMNNERTLIKKYLLECKDYIELYDNNVGFIYGLLWMIAEDIDSNIDFLSETLYGLYNKYSLNNLNKHIEAMLYYQLGRIEETKQEDLLLALSLYDKALNAYQGLLINDRILRVKIQIANVYCLLKLYEKAKKLYFETYELALNEKNCSRMKSCCNNLAFIYLNQRDYEHCLYQIELARKYESKFSALNFYESYIFYKTKSQKAARTIVKGYILQESKNDGIVLRLLKLVRSMINENDDKVDYYFRLIRQDCINMKLKIDLQLVYEMVLEYYEGNDVKCVPLLKEYINFIR